MGISVTQNFAQDKANNADQGWSETANAQSGVWCDGKMIDILDGEVRIHYIWRTFQNGKLIAREIDQFNGELISAKTAEIFRFSRVMNWELTDDWVGVTHYNLKGDMGNQIYC